MIRSCIPHARPRFVRTADEARSFPAWLAALSVFTAALLVFAPILHFDFIEWDDNIHVYANPHLNPLTRGDLLFFWRHLYENLYIPLAYMVFAGLSVIARMPAGSTGFTTTPAAFDPHVFHAASLFVHLLNCLLVFSIVNRIVRRPVCAFLGALVFAIHPVQVESVAWISELRGLLSASFCFLAIISYLHMADAAKAGAPRWRIVLGSAGATALVVLALLCKPNAVAIPAVFAILDRWVVGRRWRDILLAVAPAFALAVVFVVITHFAQPESENNNVPLYLRPLIAGDALAFYLVKLVIPVNLALDYGRSPWLVLGHWWGSVTWVLPFFCGCLLYVYRRSVPWLIAPVLIALVCVAPMLGLEPFNFQKFSTVSDRYLYLSMFGVALAVAFGVDLVLKNGSFRAGALTAIGCAMVLFGYVSVLQVGYWRDTETLFKHALKLNPRSMYVNVNYGNYLADHGFYRAAIGHYLADEKLEPDVAPMDHNMGVSLLKLRDLPDAEFEFRLAIKRDPTWVLSYVGLAETLRAEGKFPAAAAVLRAAVKREPLYASAFYDLADLDWRMGHVNDSVREYQLAIKNKPSLVGAYCGLAIVREQQGNPQAAVVLLNEALRQNPTDQHTHAMMARARQMVLDAGAAPATTVDGKG